jgi:hypothetical protein
MDIYQGDPRLFLTADGARLQFTGGQPVLDRGLENLALISLFTRPGWCGNDLFDDPNQRIGSDFEEATNQPITLAALNDIRDAAEKAMDNPAFGRVTVDVQNPHSYRLNIVIRVEPPGQDIKLLLITKNGLNWTAQALDPAYLRAQGPSSAGGLAPEGPAPGGVGWADPFGDSWDLPFGDSWGVPFGS